MISLIRPPFGRFSFSALMALGLALCVLSVLLACSLGALSFKTGDVFSALLSLMNGAGPVGDVPVISPTGEAGFVDAGVLRSVVLDLRLPRVILSLLAGAGLALAGAAFQAILRNPLADPFTLGVSGGAAFGAALAISLGFTGALWGLGLPAAAFAGAGAALFAVLSLGRLGGGLRHEMLILAGVVVSAFLAALIALVKALDEASVTGIVFWIMGSFQGRGTTELLLFLPGFLLGGAVLFCMPRELDMLSLGDRAARHMGLDATRSRLALLLAASALTASCVAVSGIIGFVGLIIPHLVRMLLGAAHKHVLAASALAGGLLLLWSDTAARSMLPGGVELPVGVLTALLGGPFFCYILGKKLTSSPLCAMREKSPSSAPKRADAPSCAAAQADRSFTRPQTGSVHIQFQAPSAGENPLDGLLLEQPDGKRPTPHLACRDLAFSYRGSRFAALSALSFGVEQGAFVGLLGPNGSGKSTLLQCLSGLLPPATGQALVNGRAIARLPEKRRARLLAALPQRPEAVPALTAFSLVLMGRYAHTPFLGGYGDKDATAALRALEECEAGHLASRPANCLSGGELQRVLLAGSLAQDAGVLLLDEPTAGLDPACAAQIMEALTRRNRERGLTVLAAMHELNLAALYCRRLIFLKEGKVLADGPTGEVFTPDVLEAAYGTRFTVVPHPVSGKPQALA